MPITFHNADIKFLLRHKKELKAFIINQVDAEANKTIVLSYIFCSDEYLLRINKQFLNHDYYTDIITFPLSEDEKTLEAEIYISIDRIRENCLSFGKAANVGLNTDEAFEKELLRVLFHGVLHLAGYKDKTLKQKAKMRQAEEDWMDKFTLQQK